jgi:OOP family OmpA-OmpF porin
MNNSHRVVYPILAGLVLTVSTGAHAQDTTVRGFALDRFDPSERGSDWFAVESLDLRGHMRPAVGLVGDWAYKPLVVYDKRTGDEVSALVENQLYAHIGGNLILWDRLRLGVNLPIGLVLNGEQSSLGGATVSTKKGANIGDLRVGADARLAGEYGGVFTAAAGVQLFAPTGSRESFTGDGSVRIVPRLMVAGDIGMLTYAGRLGLQIRTQNENFGGEPFGSEVTFAVAGGARWLNRKLTVGPELFGSTVVSDSGDGFMKKTTTPFELLMGAHYQFLPAWRAGAGVGPGLTRGYGAPQLRVVASIEWAPELEKPPTPPADQDHDGILDADDACVTVPGLPTGDPKTNGCPPPADRDGDGVLDPADACPDVPGTKSDNPKLNGCPPPPPDRDRDGILDPDDACPDVAGVKSDDPKLNGCPPPPPDRDKDGIMDPDDACPDRFGQADPDPKKNGCPKVEVTATEIKILERIEFDTGKATIRPESDPVLNAVLSTLRDHPEIAKLSIEGHTDNRGGKAYNKKLSQARAEAVMKWLTDRGIEAGRLAAQGFGQDKPIDTNNTDAGRQKNRRVEFHIVERKTPAPAGNNN